MESKTESSFTIYQADYTWMGEGMEEGIQVAVNADRIVRVGRGISSDYQRLEGSLFPGFVNGHSHAFQSLLRGKEEIYEKSSENTFWSWREHMYKLVARLGPDEFRSTCTACFREMLRAGITCVGEFHYFHHGLENGQRYQFDQLVVEAAKDSGIRLVLLNAYYQYSGCGKKPLGHEQKRFEETDLQAYWDQLDRISCEHKGVVAHSIRAVDPEQIKALILGAKARQLPFHMHVEEQLPEVEQSLSEFAKTPLRVILDMGVPLDHVTLIHCIHSTDRDMEEFIAKGGTVCVCPLTEAALADGLTNIYEMDGRVCLGTDCNARIDFFEEMRWLEFGQRIRRHKRGACCEQHSRWVTNLSKELFAYATTNGARALNVEAGEIKEGCFADLLLLESETSPQCTIDSNSILSNAIFGHAKVIDVCVGGRWRLTDRQTKHVDDVALDGISETQDAMQASIGQVLAAGEDLLLLARALIDIDSVSGSEQVMGHAMGAWLEARGWRVVKQPVGDRFNVWATRPVSPNPRLILNTHLDVVPPWFPSRIDDANLYGRGACDVKSLIAAMLIASLKLNDIGLLFVVSEETDHSGMKKANELGQNPQYLLVGEPTGKEVVTLQKGILKVQIKVNGISAHSGYPHLGRSAIHVMLSLLTKIQSHAWPKDELLGDTTVNIGLIKGGQAQNALAEYCEADLMFRLISSPKDIFDEVASICGQFEDVEVIVVSENHPVNMSYVTNLVKGFKFGPVSFNTDIPYFSFTGKAVLYGHGSITDAHCPREYISLNDLVALPAAYINIASQLLSQS